MTHPPHHPVPHHAPPPFSTMALVEPSHQQHRSPYESSDMVSTSEEAYHSAPITRPMVTYPGNYDANRPYDPGTAYDRYEGGPCNVQTQRLYAGYACEDGRTPYQDQHQIPPMPMMKVSFIRSQLGCPLEVEAFCKGRSSTLRVGYPL